jgi:hypothetical protein
MEQDNRTLMQKYNGEHECLWNTLKNLVEKSNASDTVIVLAI